MALLDDDLLTDPHTALVATERLLWAAPLTVAASIVAVHVVRLIAVRLPGVLANSTPLQWIAPTADTAILVGLAVIVFAGISASSDTPIATFKRVAFGALLVSFVPLVLVARGPMPGNGPTALALIAMHIAAYIPCVTLLPALVRMKPQTGSK